MDLSKLRLISISSLMLGVILLIIIYFIGKRKNKLGLIAVKSHRYGYIWEKLYMLLSKFFLTQRVLSSISKKLNLIGDFNISDLRKKSAQLFVLSYIPPVLLIAILSFFIKQWYLLLLIAIAFMSIANTVIDYFVNNIKSKLLEQMIEFNDALRKKYLNSMVIDEAFHDAMETLDSVKYKEILKEALKIYDILTASNGEYKINQYYISAPNKYLKLLAGICYITKEYGDSKVEDGSLLVRSISQISNELRDEILFRNRLNVGIKSLNAIAILPIFFINPLKSWASNNFFPMAKFYDSSLGFIAEMAVFTIILISFQVLKKLQTFSEEAKDLNTSDLYKNLYKRHKKVIDRIIPNTNSKNYIRKKSLMDKAMSFERIEWHYTKKVVFSFAFGVAGLAIVLAFLFISSSNLMNRPVVDRNFMGGELKGQALSHAIFLKDLDKAVIDEIYEIRSNPNSETAKRYKNLSESDRVTIILYEKHGIAEDVVLTHSQRIQNKLTALKSYSFRAVHIFIIYLFMVAGYFMPDIGLLITHRLIHMDMVSEVVKFQIIVGILVYVKSMDIEALLEWLERFSYVYKKPIQKALMNYDSGAVEALEELKDRSEYYEFQNLVQHMISCVEELSLEEAFGEFESEKLYYSKRRYDENARVVENKINIGKIFGFFPIYGLLIIYFIVPLIYVSVNELSSYFVLLK